MQSGNRVWVAQALVSLWGLAQAAYAHGFGVKISKISVARAQAALANSAVMADLAEFTADGGRGSGSGDGSGSDSDSDQNDNKADDTSIPRANSGQDSDSQIQLQLANYFIYQRIVVRGYFVWSRLASGSSSALPTAEIVNSVAISLHD